MKLKDRHTLSVSRAATCTHDSGGAGAALYSRCGLQRMNLEGYHTPEFLAGG
jgi:hypothetical protein